jgi:hypothetical protein
MTQIWQMATIVKFFEGTEMRPRMQTYESKEAGESAMKTILADMSEKLSRGVVGIPDAEGNAVASMPVMAFLGQLGIKSISYGMYEYDVHGALVLAGRPSLIIAH